MGFGPMMSSLMRNKTGPMLVALQIAVTLAIVINSLFRILQRVEKMNRDTGIDVNNVIVTYVRGFGEDFDVVDSVTNDINTMFNPIRNHDMMLILSRGGVPSSLPVR